jgi:hypothetical protein
LNQGNLIVTLNNEPKEAYESKAGNYTLAPNMVNEKKHWLQDGSTNAMWFSSCGSWAIGWQSYIEEIQNCYCHLYAPGDSTGPETATGWKYTKDGIWHVSNDNDVLVELGNTTAVS